MHVYFKFVIDSNHSGLSCMKQRKPDSHKHVYQSMVTWLNYKSNKLHVYIWRDMF